MLSKTIKLEHVPSPGAGVVDGEVYGLLREDPSAALDLHQSDRSSGGQKHALVKLMTHL